MISVTICQRVRVRSRDHQDTPPCLLIINNIKQILYYIRLFDLLPIGIIFLWKYFQFNWLICTFIINHLREDIKKETAERVKITLFTNTQWRWWYILATSPPKLMIFGFFEVIKCNSFCSFFMSSLITCFDWICSHSVKNWKSFHVLPELNHAITNVAHQQYGTKSCILNYFCIDSIFQTRANKCVMKIFIWLLLYPSRSSSSTETFLLSFLVSCCVSPVWP